MKTKFQAIANQATLDQLTAAQEWYEEARDLAVDMTELGDITFDQACCIIATYSIKQRWERNEELALRFAQGERGLPAMGAVNRIADNVMAFDDPYAALNGQKTNAFAHNIAGDLEAVTIDVWMLKASEVDHKKSPSRKLYIEISESVVEASLEGIDFGSGKVFLKPAQYQALVWIIIRGAAK